MTLPDASPLSADLAFAQSLADRADEIAMSRYLATDLVVETKPDMTPVSDADRLIERTIRAAIAERFPGDAILGEEYGGDPEPSPGREWIVDPIDGTVNFVRGVPVWATLIALAVDGVPVVGVVSAPALQRRWWASRGEGAWLRELGRSRRLSVSRVGRWGDASVSFSSLNYWDEAGLVPQATRFALEAWRDRAYGDFWSYALVAEGAIDAAAEAGLKPYDMAALYPLVTEAGGRFTGIAGTGSIWEGTALATNGLLHDRAADLLGAEA